MDRLDSSESFTEDEEEEFVTEGKNDTYSIFSSRLFFFYFRFEDSNVIDFGSSLTFVLQSLGREYSTVIVSSELSLFRS